MNSNGGWTVTNPAVVHEHAAADLHRGNLAAPDAADRGREAHSRYFSEDAYKAAAEPKELMIIDGADHVDLYDQIDVIPFDRLAAFFGEHLSA